MFLEAFTTEAGSPQRPSASCITSTSRTHCLQFSCAGAVVSRASRETALQLGLPAVDGLRSATASMAPRAFPSSARERVAAHCRMRTDE